MSRTGGTDPGALLQEAGRRLSRGDRDGAGDLAQRCLAAHPGHPGALQVLAVVAGEAGDHRRAVSLLRQALGARPDAASLHLNLATAQGRLGRHRRAVEACREAVRLAPGDAGAHVYLAAALRDAGELREARDAAEAATRHGPGNAAAFASLAEIAGRLGEPDAAYAAALRAVALAPSDANARRVAASTGSALGDADAALEHAVRAVESAPADPRNHEVRLTVARQADDARPLAAAAEAVRQCLPARHALQPLAQGYLAERRGAFSAAADAYQAALRLEPRHAAALHALARLQSRFRDFAAAAATLDRLGAVYPWGPEVAGLRAEVLEGGGDVERAMAVLEEAAVGEGPVADRARQQLVEIGLEHGEWARLEPVLEPVCRTLRERPEAPLGMGEHSLLLLPLDDAEQYALMAGHARRLRARQPRGTPADAPPPRDGVLRIGYLTGDVREHPSMHLGGHVMGRHDRGGFEAHVYSIGPPGPDNEWWQRLQREADGFRDLWRASHEEAAECIRRDGIHVLVDCMGYTRYARPEILLARPAPVQIGWLAYAATTGGDWLDYFVADAAVAPVDREPRFSEHLIRMPGCYLPTDDRQPIASDAGTRADHGLPEDAMVYCCFNSARKITAPVFDGWMRVLAAVPGSVLWLLDPGERGRANLSRRAEEAGVDPARLVFAGRRPKDEHLARHRHADLFLDTVPYNAHTTGVDALWAGLPVLTRPGGTFASRVGASLLTAVGLPELIAPTAEAYEAEAVALGRDPARRSAMSRKLAANRDTTALFDSEGYVRALEAAYAAAWDRREQGLPPAAFTVDGVRAGTRPGRGEAGER